MENISIPNVINIINFKNIYQITVEKKEEEEEFIISEEYHDNQNNSKIITFLDYKNHLLNYQRKYIFWSSNRNKINNDQIIRVKEVLKFIKYLNLDDDYKV